MYASIKYAVVMCQNFNLAKMWQKLESIKFLAKMQFQQHNSINNKLTVLKKQHIAVTNPSKL